MLALLSVVQCKLVSPVALLWHVLSLQFLADYFTVRVRTLLLPRCPQPARSLSVCLSHSMYVSELYH